MSFCYAKKYAAVVDQWIGFAAKKHLGSLKLDFSCSEFESPRKYDELYIIRSSFLSHLPNLKHCGNLKLNKLVSLDLDRVVLEGIQWQCILNSFLNIEWLRLVECNLSNLLCFGDNSRRLRSLMINRCPELHEIVLSAKNLETFEFIGKVAVKCSFIGVSKLDNVYVGLTHEMNGVEDLLKNLAGCVPGLNTLSVFEAYSKIPKLPYNPPAAFYAVSQLSWSMKTCEPETDLVLDLVCLLKAFPLMEKLYLMMPALFSSDHVELHLPPVHVHAHLKYIELGRFEEPWMVGFASYLLRSAIVLDRMVITRSVRSYRGFGKWSNFGELFNRKEGVYFRSALQGQAVSHNAKLIVPWERDVIEIIQDNEQAT